MTKKKSPQAKNVISKTEISPEELQICGIVMPISPIDGRTAEHWKEVLSILSDSIRTSGFEPNLVSNSESVSLIHKQIIQNLYANPLVVVDVSAKNPNVMFELGMKLTFDKPTIIVKDDETTYSFDTGVVEHLEYPRDLRFAKILAFQSRLADKIKATIEKANSDPTFSTFLKHFGTFTTPTIETCTFREIVHVMRPG